jgi:hypothetical protein
MLLLSVIYSNSYADIYKAHITVPSTTISGENWDTWVLKAFQLPDIELYVNNLSFGKCLDSVTCTVEFQTDTNDIMITVMDADTGLSSKDDLIASGKCNVLETCLLKKALISFEYISKAKQASYGNCNKIDADILSKKASIAITNSAGGGNIIEDIVVNCNYAPNIEYYNIQLYTSFISANTNEFCQVAGEMLIKKDGSDVSYRMTEKNTAFDNMLMTEEMKNFTGTVAKALLTNL